MEMETKKVISRVAFCEKCFQKGRPQDGDMFTVYGTHAKQLHYHRFDAPTKRSELPYLGFTPHLFMLEKIEGDKLTVLVCCGMEFCDVYWTQDEAGNRKEFEVLHAKEVIMSHKQWNALVHFTDSGMKI